MSTRAGEVVMRDCQPVSLANQEVELDVQPLARTPVPIPVRAWVHYRTIALHVGAELGAWTPRARAIRRTTAAGVEHGAWAWSNAVEKS